MKRPISTLLILTFLIGLVWMVSTPSIGALPSLIQLTNTPAPPVDAPSVLLQFPDPTVGEGTAEQALPVSPIAEQFVQDDAYARQALQYAQILRQTGRRFQVAGLGDDTNTQSTPPSGPVCKTVLLNPRMDVTEFGDGTGSIEHWAVIAQQIYYDNRPDYYRSPSHALVMGDDPEYDTQIISPTLDWDAFGQGFQAPPAMTAITVTYSRLYTNTNAGDTAWGNLWTLDSQGYLDELILYWHIGESPSGWSDRRVVITNTAALAALSGRPLALVFDVEANRASPYEFIWLDDAQMTICYRPPAQAIYLPVVMRQYGVVTGPACMPYEPDSVNQRGSTAVGATCYGSFSVTDIKDYYSLDLRGVAQVRLSLTNLPSGTNWDAMIYEDAPGYPLACHIGIPGSGDKSKDCNLNLNKSYFVLVSAGTAPTGGANTYQMSVTSLTTPTPPPTTKTVTLYSVADSCILEGYPTVNVGSAVDMWVGYDDYLNPDGKIVRSLVRFDLSSIPSGATINNATLRLYLVNSWDYPGKTRTITTYRISSSWSESSVTWNTSPSHAEAYGSTGVTHGGDVWYSFDVTNLVRGWVNGTWPNYGIMLRGPEWSGSDSSWKAFATRESNYDPQLVINYVGTASASAAMPDQGEPEAPTILRALGIDTRLLNACDRYPASVPRCLSSPLER